MSSVLICTAMVLMKRMIDTLNKTNKVLAKSEKFKLNPIATVLHSILLIVMVLVSLLQLGFVLAGNAVKIQA